MILPRWYRLARSLWALPSAVLFWYCSFALLSVDHASPEIQASGSEQEVLIIARILGVMFIFAGVASIAFGWYMYNRLPYRMRQHSFEESRLGQAICKEVGWLFGSSKEWFGEHDFGDHVLSWYTRYFQKSRLWNNLRFLFGSYLLHDVHVRRRQAGIMDNEGVEHCPTVVLIIEIPTGIVRWRDERIEKYKDGHPIFDNREEFDEANWKFKKQMQLDKSSAEELQLFLDDLRGI
jgi:hypothetical protein